MGSPVAPKRGRQGKFKIIREEELLVHRGWSGVCGEMGHGLQTEAPEFCDTAFFATKATSLLTTYKTHEFLKLLPNLKAKGIQEQQWNPESVLSRSPSATRRALPAPRRRARRYKRFGRTTAHRYFERRQACGLARYAFSASSSLR